jgi:hypothetical protein
LWWAILALLTCRQSVIVPVGEPAKEPAMMPLKEWAMMGSGRYSAKSLWVTMHSPNPMNFLATCESPSEQAMNLMLRRMHPRMKLGLDPRTKIRLHPRMELGLDPRTKMRLYPRMKLGMCMPRKILRG